MDHAPALPTAPPDDNLSPEEAEALTRSRIVYAHSQALLGSESFQWFARECLAAATAAAQSEALDLRTTPQERDIACHVHAALERLTRWTEEQRDAARDYIQSVQH